jgi:hypothetical protein
LNATTGATDLVIQPRAGEALLLFIFKKSLREILSSAYRY